MRQWKKISHCKIFKNKMQKRKTIFSRTSTTRRWKSIYKTYIWDGAGSMWIFSRGYKFYFDFGENVEMMLFLLEISFLHFKNDNNVVSSTRAAAKKILFFLNKSVSGECNGARVWNE
jgi:hypothetical protein